MFRVAMFKSNRILLPFSADTGILSALVHSFGESTKWLLTFQFLFCIFFFVSFAAKMFVVSPMLNALLACCDVDVIEIELETMWNGRAGAKWKISATR